MAQQRRGLGKGLGALIPDAQRTNQGAVGSTGSAGAADPTQPGRGHLRLLRRRAGEAARRPTATAGCVRSTAPTSRKWRSARSRPTPASRALTFDEEALEELAASIAEVGLLQPVVVRKLGPGRYELVMGERRMRASQRAGLEYIPAIVRETSDNDMLRDALIENLHRAQLDPLEEAAAYKQLLDDFGATHEQLAQRIGRSRPHISNTLRLLGLPPAVQRRVAAGVISAGHARALL